MMKIDCWEPFSSQSSTQLSPPMSKRTGFRFHTKTTHGPPASPIVPPKPDLEPDKQPNSHETSASHHGGRRMGFPSSMFQKSEKNNGRSDPTVITDGGWVRPSPTGWSLPPDALASNNERSPAVIFGSGKKWGWGSGHALPAVKKATGMETIDSSEAAKKYGGRFMF